MFPSGVTRTELLVLLAMIAVLVSLAIPSLLAPEAPPPDGAPVAEGHHEAPTAAY